METVNMRKWKTGDVVKGWARTAYDAYRDYFAHHQNIPPQWEDLPDEIKSAWIRAAVTLVGECREWDASGYRVLDDGTVNPWKPQT
jgi:hypothetical protein